MSTPDADAGPPLGGGDGGGDSAPPPPSPDLADALRQLGATGRAGLGAGIDTARAFRRLLLADLALARGALGQALAFTGMAIAFGASAWLLLMAALVVFLNAALGLPWLWALLLGALLSLGLTAYGGWRAVGYFAHTRLQATRRQLARLGLGDDDDDDAPPPGSSGS